MSSALPKGPDQLQQVTFRTEASSSVERVLASLKVLLRGNTDVSPSVGPGLDRATPFGSRRLIPILNRPEEVGWS